MVSLKKIIGNKLVSNSLWLFVLQIFNTVVPLLTIPYVTRVLGPENYGFFSLSLNWVTYFQVIVEFGFAFVGARKVSIAGDKDIQGLFSRIITARIILLVLSFSLMNIICLCIGIDMIQYICMCILFCIVVGVAFQLNWLFQGKQNMKVITIVNACARFVSVVMVFLVVKSKDNLYLYCFCYSITFLMSAVFGLWYANKKYGLRLKLSSFQAAVQEMKEGFYLFTSQAMSKIFSSIGITILGFVTTEYMIGVYSAIYKIPYVMVLFFNPISQALFPYLSQKYAGDFSKGFKTTLKAMGIVMLPFVGGGLFIIAFRDFFVRLILGDSYVAFSNLIIPLIIWCLLSILNNFLGIQILVASEHQKAYSFAFTIGIIFVVLSNILMGLMWQTYGIAYATAIGEFGFTLLLFYQCVKLKTSQG